MTAIPIIRIDLESMKHSIVMAYTEHMAKIDSDVQAAITAAVDNFDIASEVRRIVNVSIAEALKSAIERQFRYDTGAGYQAIQKVAEDLAAKALKNISANPN